MRFPFTSDDLAVLDQDRLDEDNLGGADALARDAQTLNRLRWQISQLVLVIASLAMISQFLLTLASSSDGVHSLVALLAGSLWFALWAAVQGALRRVSPNVERSGYLGALALLLVFYTRVMVSIFAGTRPLGETGEIYPWFAAVFTVAFIVYSGRTALVLCASIVFYTASLNAFFILRAAFGGAEVVALAASVDLFTANAILLLMLFLLKRNTEAWARTQAHAEALAQLAHRDALTRLYNRRYLNRALREEVSRARRYAHPLSVALCDVDEFKRVNDRFSHGVGDRVLQEVARILECSVRGVDTVARYGGEEFVFIFPETDAAQARTACEKIRQEVARYPWAQLHPDLRVTVSIGVADGSGGPEQLLKRRRPQALRGQAARAKPGAVLGTGCGVCNPDALQMERC